MIAAVIIAAVTIAAVMIAAVMIAAVTIAAVMIAAVMIAAVMIAAVIIAAVMIAAVTIAAVMIAAVTIAAVIIAAVTKSTTSLSYIHNFKKFSPWDFTNNFKVLCGTFVAILNSAISKGNHFRNLVFWVKTVIIETVRCSLTKVHSSITN
ncbi:MAG: hypothetical protein MSA01_04030 [Anaeromassilibacillus sp.]|nr:hypothetical protein [Anaeromassilibacillus sp.]